MYSRGVSAGCDVEKLVPAADESSGLIIEILCVIFISYMKFRLRFEAVFMLFFLNFGLLLKENLSFLFHYGEWKLDGRDLFKRISNWACALLFQHYWHHKCMPKPEWNWIIDAYQCMHFLYIGCILRKEDKLIVVGRVYVIINILKLKGKFYWMAAMTIKWVGKSIRKGDKMVVIGDRNWRGRLKSSWVEVIKKDMLT